MALAELEILAEGLVTAPPVEPDHVELLVATHLMEVRVADVVFLVICGHALVVVDSRSVLVDFSERVAPVLHHTLFLVLNKGEGHE